MFGDWLARVREHKPLVHNITNLVVMQISANALLAVGASPVMAHAAEEVEDMAAAAGALVLNIGTLDPTWVRSMEMAQNAAVRHGVPVILDPVGAGATPYRTRTAQALFEAHSPSVLRGNAGEISVLAGGEGVVRGVDAASDGVRVDDVVALARRMSGVVAATGPVDVVSDGRRVARIANGDPWLALVTGTGCSLSGLMGAFAAVTDPAARADQLLEAVVAALLTFEIAAERARPQSSGPGTFHAHLLDALYSLTPAEVDQGARVAWD